jgi:hypothetical protein
VLIDVKAPPLRERLRDFFRIHDPARLARLDDVCAVVTAAGPEGEVRLEEEYDARGGITAPHLDIRSVFFDPRRALYSSTTLPPVPGARPTECLFFFPKPLNCAELRDNGTDQ